MMAVLGGVVFGFSQLKPSIVHAQTPVTQVQVPVTTVKKDSDIVVAKELEGAETNNSTGHQDVLDSVDHQFEGVE